MTLKDRITAALSALRGGSVGVSNEALDHPNGTLTAAEGLRLGLFGAGFGWGPAVTDSTAMQVGTVYACTSKLAGAVSQLPLHEYTVDATGSRERVTPNSPLWWMLNESPSPAWTASAWKQWVVRCVKLRGDQHTEIVRNWRGDVLELKPHHPDDVVTRTVDGRLRYDVRDRHTGRMYGVDQDDMLHFTGFGFDGERSMSAIRWAARSAIASELGAAEYMGKTVTDGGMPKIVLKYPQKVSESAGRDLKAQFAANYGSSGGSNIPLILSEGADARELSIDPVDMELLATRKFSTSTICQVIGVPPIIIGDSEKTSSWGTGIEQITIGWVRFDIAPLVAGWEEELNRKLFRRAGKFVEFSLMALMRGDSKAQADSYRAALGGPGSGDGWMSVNQVRKIENLPPLEGDEYNIPFRAQRGTDAPKQGTTP
jgi:HK97 family phage portal protein